MKEINMQLDLPPIKLSVSMYAGDFEVSTYFTKFISCTIETENQIPRLWGCYGGGHGIRG